MLRACCASHQLHQPQAADNTAIPVNTRKVKAQRLLRRKASRAACSPLLRLAAFLFRLSLFFQYQPLVTAFADHAGQHVVNQLNTFDPVALLQPQHPALHQLIQGLRRNAGGAQRVFIRLAVAKAGEGDEFVLDEPAQFR